MRLPPSVKFIQRGWFNSNHILITGGDGPVIVDTGHRADAAETVCLLRAAGVEPATIRLIVNTHCHWDHYGGNRALQALSGAPVATGAATADIFARNDQRAMWLDYFGVTAEPVTADITWQDGDEVEWGGLRFQVIAAPGHAPDAIALFQPDHRLLLCADALHENDCGILNVAVHGEAALAEAMATVERFRELGVALALPGHGPPITNVVGSLDRLAQRLARFQRDPAHLAWHLSRRVMMAYLLGWQPIGRTALIGRVSPWPWADEYAGRCGYQDVYLFLNGLLDDFVARGIAREVAGALTSIIPR
jgi:glyoxylase-like metal-dependent hydrolase (beta-lactamase superfamily II)